MMYVCYLNESSVDPDEMPHSAAFHLGLHCLPKYIGVAPITQVSHVRNKNSNIQGR